MTTQAKNTKCVDCGKMCVFDWCKRCPTCFKRICAKGLCQECGKAKATTGMKYCSACYEKIRQKICIHCHTNIAMNGTIFCQTCDAIPKCVWCGERPGHYLSKVCAKCRFELGIRTCFQCGEAHDTGKRCCSRECAFALKKKEEQSAPAPEVSPVQVLPPTTGQVLPPTTVPASVVPTYADIAKKIHVIEESPNTKLIVQVEVIPPNVFAEGRSWADMVEEEEKMKK
jgi:hypothetical protein